MTLSHERAGEGPVVLLLHSGVCDRRMWGPQRDALVTAGYQVLAPDLRGHGETPGDAGDYSDAEDVRDLLDALGVERAAVVGASWGGRVALEFAARLPGRVDALALLCSGMPGHEPGPALRAFAEREDELLEAGDLAGAAAYNAEFWLGPDATDAVRARVAEMQRHAFEADLAAEARAVPEDAERAPAAPAPPAPDLSRITAPALAVGGAHDIEDFRRIAARLAATLPAARHLELPWAGHLPSLERPDETADLLLDFLREARS
ncbi:alpha/beta hydrolase [Streptomyces sp. NPDC001941]|uniref:alpha/beta fold hydrolase n=1 Tax=Streptomyces sp. NPDC001941 TaxID=3154659 RepID=UPI0033213D62